MRVVRGATVLLLIASLASGGCMHSRATHLADGQRGYSISCAAVGHKWTSCLVRAGRLCGERGYLVSYADEIERELLVECKGATPK